MDEKRKSLILKVLVVLFLLGLGIALGFTFRKYREWNILEKQYQQEIEQLDQQLEQTKVNLDIKEDLAEEAVERAQKFEEEVIVLKKENETISVEVNKYKKIVEEDSKTEPTNLVACKLQNKTLKQYAGKLEEQNTVLTKTVEKADEQVFDLKLTIKYKDEVIALKDDYIETTEEKLDLANKKNRDLKRTVKKDRKTKIWSNILSGATGLSIGIPLGGLTN